MTTASIAARIVGFGRGGKRGIERRSLRRARPQQSRPGPGTGAARRALRLRRAAERRDRQDARRRPRHVAPTAPLAASASPTAKATAHETRRTPPSSEFGGAGVCGKPAGIGRGSASVLRHAHPLSRHRGRRVHRVGPGARAACPRRPRACHRQLLRRASARTWPTSASDVELIEADIRDEAALARALDGIELVFHEAAIPSVPRSLADPLREPRGQRHRHAQAARAAPEGRGPAPGLRRLLVGLRRHADPAQDRNDAADAALSLRRLEAGGRALLPGVRRCVRPRDGLPPLLQRLRPPPGSEVGVRRRHPALRDGRARPGRGSPSTATARSHATSASSTTSSRRTCAAGSRPGVSGRVFNVACGAAIDLNDVVRLVGEIVGHDLPVTYVAGAGGRRQALARRHHRGARASRLPRRDLVRRGTAAHGRLVRRSGAERSARRLAALGHSRRFSRRFAGRAAPDRRGRVASLRAPWRRCGG